LTGIPPQTQGEKRFKEEMGRLDRYEYPFSMIVFTLENLEDFHREMKYNAEQDPLKEFTSLLRNRLRVSDICSRYGRNQVTVMLPNTDSEQARAVCDKMEKGFQEQEIARSPETMKAQADSGTGPNAGTDPGFCLSVSVGITEVTLGETLQSAVQKAESNRDSFHQFTIC
jgi:diguanylate cyclase (GGDEF)-like protein